MTDSSDDDRYTLSTERVVLRPWTNLLSSVILSVLSDPNVYRTLWDGTSPNASHIQALTLESIRSFAAERFGLWLITDSDNVVFGFAGLRRLPDVDAVELVFGLTPSARGHGYATEACSAILRYAFRNTTLHTIWASAHQTNESSIRVLKRLSMTQNVVIKSPVGPLLHFSISNPTPVPTAGA